MFSLNEKISRFYLPANKYHAREEFRRETQCYHPNMPMLILVHHIIVRLLEQEIGSQLFVLVAREISLDGLISWKTKTHQLITVRICSLNGFGIHSLAQLQIVPPQ